MATNDGFDPGNSLPLFLGKPEQEIGTNRAVILLRGLTVAAAIAICIGILSISSDALCGRYSFAGR